jgi:hypothetical protein
MTQLYRHWDGSDPPRLLYVGIATAASARQMAHAGHSGWMKLVRTITVSEPYPSRQAALAAEAAAIKSEKPRFNTVHAPTKPTDVPIHPSRQGEALLRRLKAGQRTAGTTTSDFSTRTEQALASIRALEPP